MSFFQSALLRRMQPFSVILLLTKYKHSYRDLTFSATATVPSRDVHIPYLRWHCNLIYLLTTEAEVNQSADVGSAEGDAPLFPNAIVIYIYPQLPSYNLIYCSFSSSLSSTARRRRGRSAATILF